MPATRRSNAQLKTFLTAGAPIVVVAVARLFVGSTPADAGANEGDEFEIIVIGDPGDELDQADQILPSNDEQAAIDWFAAWSSPQQARSPMYHPRDEMASDPTGGSHDSGPADAASTGPNRPKSPFKLTAILGRGDRGVASINGKLYRAGDTVAKGWRIAAISPRDGTATLTGPDGEVVVLERPLPDKPLPEDSLEPGG